MAYRGNEDQDALLEADALVGWADEALRAVEEQLPRRRWSVSRRLWIWRLDDGRLGVWSRAGMRRGTPASCWVAFAYFFGLGLIFWAVWGLRAGDVVMWRWVTAGALVTIGAVAFARSKTLVLLPSRDAMITAPDGLVSAVDDRHRVVERTSITGVDVRDGEVVALRRSGPPLSLLSGRGDDAEAELAEQAELLRGWLRDGVIPEAPETFTPDQSDGPVFWVGTLLTGAVIWGGFCYLTCVMGARSDAGVAVRGFVDELAGGKDELAYQRLTEDYRQEHSLEEFREEVPPSFREAEGFDVNGISTATGFDGTERTCIDGWLDGVTEGSGYAFAVRHQGDVARIAGWKAANCRSKWWIHDGE